MVGKANKPTKFNEGQLSMANVSKENKNIVRYLDW